MHRFVKKSFSFFYRYARRWAAGLLLTSLVVAAAWSAGVAPPVENGRADLIVIDRLKAFGPLERPAVVFAHDLHTAALAGQNKDKDCLTCHLMDPGRNLLSPLYQHLGERDRQSLMDLFHDRCITCHQELRKQNKKTGPVECGECHVADVKLFSTREPMGLNRSLHFRHVKASGNKCERCHHEYDPVAKKRFYAKGREGACLYCHKEHTEDNRISNRLASHEACINCHRDLRLQNKTAGPITCGGCHDPKEQAKIEPVRDIPRLERNQPDTALVKIQLPQAPGMPQARMPRVPFDHKRHELDADQCRTCHHAAISSCAECHTIQGRSEGKGVNLSQAMHQPDSAISCVGCHAQRQTRRQCAGCHGAIPAARTWSSRHACKICHLAPSTPDTLTEDEARILAARLIASQRTEPAPLSWEEIPEKVAISPLKDQYEPAMMPHRQIVRKLVEQIKDDRLATVFHDEQLTVCQGCHHNSPASLKPPQCRSCHGRASAASPNRPGLMAAYHEQCMQCHERMGLTRPAGRDCTSCHSKKRV